MRSSRYIIIRKHRKSAADGSRPISALKGIGLMLLTLMLCTLTGIALAYAIYSQSLPSLDIFWLQYSNHPEPTRFYARDGETLLFTLAYENFSSKELKICESDGENCFPGTFLAAAAITRQQAVERNEKYSIAEEMVRDVYAENIRSSRRPDLTAKLLTFQIRQKYGNDQITEWYYNNAWFGQMAFGLDAAARLYLDKPGDSLNDAECVLLSAVVNAPMLNPIDSKGALRDFYLNGLAALQRADLFDEEKADELARSNFIIFEPPQYVGSSQPDLITRKALDAALNLYGREQVERGGMKIITSEDPDLQNYLTCITSAENEAENSPCPLNASYSDQERQAAAEALRTAPVSVAILDNKSGQVLAELEAQVNGENQRVYAPALNSYPVGTLINYFAALTAFSGGSSPSTLMWDLKNMYDGTQSDDSDFQGPVQMRTALTSDFQRPLTAHLQQFGSGAVQRNAALFGLGSSFSMKDSEVLYRGGSSTAETFAYSLVPFATLGSQTGSSSGGSMHPVSILRIEREDGKIEIPQPKTQKSLIAENLAFLVHNVFLQESGNLSLSDRPSAVKIGTLSGDSSLWISGYTRELSCAIRVADPQIISAFVVDSDRIQKTTEVLWQSVMEYAHQGIPASGWKTPEDISQVKICLPSGKLPTTACRETRTEIFLKGNEPYEYDTFYTEVPINRENRMLATRFTPPENVVKEIFADFPEYASEWAAENGIEAVPTAYDPIRNDIKQNKIRIESPAEFQVFNQNERIDVIVRTSLNETSESMQVSLGSGMYPEEWQEVCSGEALEDGQWLLCSLDSNSLEPGLYVLRTAFILPDRSYHSAETCFTIE